MTDAVLAQHPPALKVAGRRLSVSSKPKPHLASELSPTSPTDRDPVDYPRPAPPSAGADAEPPVHAPHTDDDVPKKEKKHGQGHDEKKLRDLAVRRAEATRPTREAGGGKSGFGAGGRIAQPAGKMFA